MLWFRPRHCLLIDAITGFANTSRLQLYGNAGSVSHGNADVLKGTRFTTLVVAFVSPVNEFLRDWCAVCERADRNTTPIVQRNDSKIFLIDSSSNTRFCLNLIFTFCICTELCIRAQLFRSEHTTSGLSTLLPV